MRIRHFKIIFFLIGSFLILTGCASNEKFVIKTNPNSNIYLANETTPTSITDNSGIARLSIPSNIYSSYVTVLSPEYVYPVPIGLNIKKSNHGLGWKLGSGLVAMTAGVPVALLGGDAAFLAGLGLISVGFIETLTFGLDAFIKSTNITYAMHFTYVDNQVLNIPNLSSSLLHPDQPKTKSDETIRVKRQQAKSVTDETGNESYTTSKLIRGNLSKKIIGNYKGTGQLLINKSIEENYKDITIQVREIDRNHVSMVILESGEEFFEKPLLFEVKSTKGGYSLVNSKIPSIKITITKDETISFLNPKVNIDGTIYTLSCNAKK